MDVQQAQAPVLNPSLRRSASTSEVVETRRRLARKTGQPPIVGTSPRSRRQTAEVYSEVPTQAEAPRRSWIPASLALSAALLVVAVSALTL